MKQCIHAVGTQNMTRQSVPKLVWLLSNWQECKSNLDAINKPQGMPGIKFKVVNTRSTASFTWCNEDGVGTVRYTSSGSITWWKSNQSASVTADVKRISTSHQSTAVEVHIGFHRGNLKEWGYLEDPGVDGRIMLKWIFERLDGGA
jgi:hypothetical protein